MCLTFQEECGAGLGKLGGARFEGCFGSDAWMGKEKPARKAATGSGCTGCETRSGVKPFQETKPAALASGSL